MNNYPHKYKYIADNLSEETILRQLAEEAAELAQAALKMCRVLDGTNPTPITERQARNNMLEEIADVQNAFNAYAYKKRIDFSQSVEEIVSEKRYRWEDRLREKEQKERAGNAEG